MSANQPAYPHDDGPYAKHGLTKRELIAAMAMQGLASVPSPGGVTTAGIAHDVGAAVAYADALLAELAKEPQA